MTIKINNQDYKIKQTIRALFLFEEISNKPFEIKTTLDNYLYFYCLLLANNPDFMDWDAFVDSLDNDPNIIVEITNLLNQQQKIEKLLDTEEVDDDGKKKRLKVAELYSILVLQFGLTPSYVMDEIQQYEIKSLMDYGYYKHKEDWEQTRLISYLIAQTNSKKKLKLPI